MYMRGRPVSEQRAQFCACFVCVQRTLGNFTQAVIRGAGHIAPYDQVGVRSFAHTLLRFVLL